MPVTRLDGFGARSASNPPSLSTYTQELYQNSEIKRAPIVDYGSAAKLIPHSRTLELENYATMLEKTRHLERNSRGWMLRDVICTKIIKYMRRNGISSLDSNGLPTVFEMALLSMQCTSLEKDHLDHVLEMVS